MRADMSLRRTIAALAVAGIALLLVANAALCAEKGSLRKVIKLDGTWEIAQGSMHSIPESFDRRVPVPGLVDLARPAFAEVGRKSERREAFWYRRTFKVEGPIPTIAMLKIHKAKFGTKVFLNGEPVGQHVPFFTPGLFDVKKYLEGSGKQNELIIRVGADRECLGDSVPTGWDFEKYLYIPGIYDSVELILTGAPYISNIQVVPQLEKKSIRINSLIQNPTRKGKVEIDIRVRELKSQRTHCFTESTLTRVKDALEFPFDLELPMGDYKLWSPEEPFLYEVELSIGTDALGARFGMRSFSFDAKSGRAILNGKPYFMRGTNVCVYRFFEDAERGDKPWREEWVRRLHQKFKGMHWNSIRYCIGFPPEIWYDIADEEGFLIQDEFPIWYLNEWPASLKSDVIASQYAEWMRERWNHPCVVIWDAQNESVTEETAKAIAAVRHLDLSDRPWDNGWAVPQSSADCLEAHPYLFSTIQWGTGQFRLSDLANTSGKPRLRDVQQGYDLPIIINEYAWLWLNRDGTTTCLTDKVYSSLLGPDSTIAQRRLLYARYLAALTEFWRGQRKCAGVLHFCGLGYSRPGDKPRPEGGATSDHFLDIETLTFEPNFERFVRDAFSPVALCINKWDEQLSPGAEIDVPVVVVNDLYNSWSGNVYLRIVRGEETVSEQSKMCTVSSLGREIVSFKQVVPGQVGKYQLVAELTARGGDVVQSLRDFEVVRSSK